MADSKLVLPYDVEGVVLDVLKRRHKEHLAKLERARGVRPRTFENYVTMVRMSDAQALRLSGDTVPALLLGTIGAPGVRRNDVDGIDVVFQLGMQVTVMGEKRRDTLLRRDAMAWTTIECMYQRVPRARGGPISAVRLTDYEPIADGDSQRTLGDARLVFEVDVPDVLTITGGLPADDSPWPPEAGGAPVDPYDAVPDRPAATTTVTVDRQPTVE